MAYTMFNQQPCKIHSSERHNSRTQELDYIFPELTHNNESFYFDNRNLIEIYNECKELYEKKLEKKFQEKTAPIREGVVLIDENTTLDDVKRLAEELGKLLKWKPLQVHIHRDEGHKLSPDNKEGSEVAKLNLHAHIVFDTQDKEKGKMNNSGKENLSKAQDVCARVLRMERGKPSTKKHLDALKFKIKKEEERIQALLEENVKMFRQNVLFEVESAHILSEKREIQRKVEENKAHLLELQNDIQKLKRDIQEQRQEKSKVSNELLLLQEKQKAENQAFQRYIEEQKKEKSKIAGELLLLQQDRDSKFSEKQKLQEENKKLQEEKQKLLDEKEKEIKSIDEKMEEKIKEYDNMLRDNAGDEGIMKFMAREIKRMSEERNDTEAEIIQEIEEHIEELNNKNRGLKR